MPDPKEKPKFDPNKKFEPVTESEPKKPAFNPNASFEPVENIDAEKKKNLQSQSPLNSESDFSTSGLGTGASGSQEPYSFDWNSVKKQAESGGVESALGTKIPFTPNDLIASTSSSVGGMPVMKESGFLQKQQMLQNHVDVRKKVDAYDQFKSEQQKKILEGGQVDNIPDSYQFYGDYLKKNDPDQYNYNLSKFGELNKKVEDIKSGAISYDNEKEKQNFLNQAQTELQQHYADMESKSIQMGATVAGGKLMMAQNNMQKYYGDQVQAIKNIGTQQKDLVPQIQALEKKISSYPTDDNGQIIITPFNKADAQTAVQQHNDLLAQYKSLQQQQQELQSTPGYQDYKQQLDDVVNQYNGLQQQAQNFIKKYPKVEEEMLQQKVQQDKTDQDYKNMPLPMRISASMTASVGRGVTDFVKGLVYIPKMLGQGDEYGWADKAYESFDKGATNFENSTLSLPTDYNKPVYDTKTGEYNLTYLPAKIAYTGTQMAMMIGTAELGAGGMAGMGMSGELGSVAGQFVGGFVTSAEGGYKDAINAGMSEKDAENFSGVLATQQALLELIAPEQKFVKGSMKGAIDDYIKSIAGGMSKKEALATTLKSFSKEILKDVGKETLQEYSQMFDEIGTKMIAGDMTGINFHATDDMKNQMIETGVLTILTTGIVSGGGKVSSIGANKFTQQALFMAANNPEPILNMIQQKNNLSPEKKAELTSKITLASEELKKIPSNISDQKKSQILPDLLQKRQLQEEKKATDKVFHADIDEQINRQDARISDLVDKPENGLSVEENHQFNELTELKKNNVDLTEEEQKQLDAFENKIDEHKISNTPKQTPAATTETTTENKTPTPVQEVVANPTEEKVVAPLIENKAEVPTFKNNQNGQETSQKTNEAEVLTPEQQGGQENASPVKQNELPNVKSGNTEYSMEVNDKGIGKYTDINTGAELPMDTHRYQRLEEQRRKNLIPKEEQQKIQEESPSEVPVVEATQKDDADVVKRLNDDMQVLKALPKDKAGKPIIEKKYEAVIKRLYEAKNNKTISRETFKQYKQSFTDVFGGKLNLDAENVVIKANAVFEKVKKLVPVSNFKGQRSGTVSNEDVVKLIDFAQRITIAAIRGGASLNTAIQKGIQSVKNNARYRKLGERGDVNIDQIEKEITSHAEEFVKKEEEKIAKAKERSENRKEGSPMEGKKESPAEPSTKKKENPDKEKSLFASLMLGEKISPETKKIIEKKGLTYKSFSNKEANEIAKEIISQKGIEGALNEARNNKDIVGSIKTLIYGNVINEYVNKEKEATAPEEKELFAQKQGDVADELDQFVRDSGRIISGLQEFYAMSPLGISAKEKAGIMRRNKRLAEQKGYEKKKDKIQEELEAIDKNENLSDEQKKQSKLSVLNRILPRKKVAGKKMSDHERILLAFDNGAFDGTSRTYKDENGKETTETFEDLIYQKYGLINVNSAEFKAKLKEFADNINKTPENSDLRNQEYQKMYDYVQSQQVKSLIDTGMSVWYANILSSYETHLRNMKYNAFTVVANQNLLLAEKALLKGDFNQMFDVMTTGLKGFGLGFLEAQQVMKGGISRFDKPGFRPTLDQEKGLLKLHKYPGRALRAADILFTAPLVAAKQKEMLYNMVRNEAKEKGEKISNQEVKDRVIAYLGNTEARIESAQQTAAADIEKVYGADWKNNKEAQARYKIRIQEIIEQTRPAQVKEESIEWSRRAVVTNTPRGMWRPIAQAVSMLINAIPGGKLVIPFVNIAFNLTDRMIERSPIGFINAIRGAKGFNGNKEQMTADEQKEAMMKAINYTVSMAAVLAVAVKFADDDDEKEKNTFCITGKNTGNYMKDGTLHIGGKMDPYSIYFKGVKVLEYKDTPLAGIFAPAGFYRDYVKYGKNESVGAGATKTVFDYLAFVSDLAAVKGLKEFLNFFSPEQYREVDAGKVSKSLAATAQNFFVPNLVKAVNNDVRGALGYNDYKASDWKQALLKDIPFAEQLMNDEKYDQLGRPIKDQFKIPLVPYEKWQPEDKYYKLFTDKKFFPSYVDDKIIERNGKETEMTEPELHKLHTERGKIVMNEIDNNIEELKGLNNDDFKKRMHSIFSYAGKEAKMNLYGN